MVKHVKMTSFEFLFFLQGTANMTHDKIMTGSSAGILPPNICGSFPPSSETRQPGCLVDPDVDPHVPRPPKAAWEGCEWTDWEATKRWGWSSPARWYWRAHGVAQWWRKRCAGRVPCPKKLRQSFLELEMFSICPCSFAGDFQYLAGYCFELSGMLGWYPQVQTHLGLGDRWSYRIEKDWSGFIEGFESWSEFFGFDGEHWLGWFGGNVAIPHCTNCSHFAGSTLFVPQLVGRLGGIKLGRRCPQHTFFFGRRVTICGGKTMSRRLDVVEAGDQNRKLWMPRQISKLDFSQHRVRNCKKLRKNSYVDYRIEVSEFRTPTIELFSCRMPVSKYHWWNLHKFTDRLVLQLWRLVSDCSAALRLVLLLCEFLGLQVVIQNRLQTIWEALNRPGCKLCLDRCLRIEVGSFFVGVPCAGLLMLLNVQLMSGASIPGSLMALLAFVSFSVLCAVPICFLIWILLVAGTLNRVVWTFHRALKVARQEGLTIAATFQACRGRSILQCTGVISSLTTSLMLIFVVVKGVVMTSESGDNAVGLQAGLHHSITPQCVNLLVNAASIILLSGAFRQITGKGVLRLPPLGCCRCRCRFRRCCGFRSPCKSTNLKTSEETDWDKKTRELASRGISVEELLVFYKGLGDTVMPSFQPSVHTTNDVVRLAIIPLTSSNCSSYAQLVNKGEKVLPKKMITHNWSNLFRDLLASVIADVLEEHTFEFIAGLLSDKAGVDVVEQILRVHGSLQETYWICAFAVNQHAGICGANPTGTVDPVTGLTHPTCKCSEPKFFNQDPPFECWW